MQWLNCERMRLVLIGVVASIVFCGSGHLKAEIIMSEPTGGGPVINDAADVQ